MCIMNARNSDMFGKILTRGYPHDKNVRRKQMARRHIVNQAHRRYADEPSAKLL